MFYRLQYTITFQQHTKDEVEYFEANNDTLAKTEGNNRVNAIANTSNKKLFNLGNIVTL